MMNSDQNNNELNDYLNGNSELSKVYRAAKTDTPSHDLDKNILQAARESVESEKSKNNHQFHKSKWSVPVSIAAMITLSVSLVVTMQQESGQQLINEPKLEMHDAADVMEETEFFKAEKKDDALSVSNETLKQSNDNLLEMDVPASAPSAESYRVEEKIEVLESRMKVIPTKKIISKEKARTNYIELEKRQLSDNKVKTMNAGSVSLDEVNSDAMIIQSQKVELTEIKTLWEKNEFETARKAYIHFIKSYPDATQERIKEILGLNVYNELSGL